MDAASQHQSFMYADAMANAAAWSTDVSAPDAGLFYAQHELDNAHYVMHAQQQQQLAMPLQSTSSAMASGGVLTRAQRARVAAEQSSQHSLPVTPDALGSQSTRRSPVYAGQFQQMSMFADQGPFMDPIPHTQSPSQRPSLSLSAGPHHFQGSPQYPSTPTTVSSTPSSRAYYSAGGRSTSPALSVASTSLTSLSGGQHASFHPRDHQNLADCGMDTAPDGSQQAFQSEHAAGSAFDFSNDADGVAPLGGRVPRTRKTRLYNIDRKAICCFAKSHPEARQEDIAARYGVERSTISKILKQKQKWMNVPEGEELKIIKHRPSKFPALEKRLLIQLKQCSRDTPPVTLTDQLIRNKAREVAKDIGITEDKFKASSGWVENFKHRHNIRRGVLIGRRRHRHTGVDGELTGEEESDYENAILEGEEGLTKEERLAQRAEKKRERMEFFRIAEERVMEEHGEQIEQGHIDEELRMELVLGVRAELLRAKRAGKPIQRVKPGLAYSDDGAALAEAIRVTENPAAEPIPYVVLPQAQYTVQGPSGVTSYGQAAASSSAQPTAQLANVNAALQYVTQTLTEDFMTKDEKAVIHAMRERVRRSSGRHA